MTVPILRVDTVANVSTVVISVICHTSAVVSYMGHVFTGPVVLNTGVDAVRDHIRILNDVLFQVLKVT